MAEIAAVVLAAGLGSRFRAAGGEGAKLTALYRGRPLVRWAAEAALASRATPVIVVTGHARAEVEAALGGLDLCFVHNGDFAAGLAGSLRAGVAAAPAGARGALALLGDMPEVSAATLDALIAAFLARPQARAAAATHAGRRGVPALLGRALFAEVAALRGDEGARRFLRGPGVIEVEVADAAALRDVDAPDDLLRLI